MLMLLHCRRSPKKGWKSHETTWNHRFHLKKVLDFWNLLNLDKNKSYYLFRSMIYFTRFLFLSIFIQIFSISLFLFFIFYFFFLSFLFLSFFSFSNLFFYFFSLFSFSLFLSFFYSNLFYEYFVLAWTSIVYDLPSL